MAEVQGEGNALSGGDSVVVTEAPAQAEGAGEAEPVEGAGEAVTFETMGVTEEQFGKFYSSDKGYNWEAHAKEAEFKAAQKPAGGDVTPDPNASVAPDPNAAAESAVAQAGLDMDGLGTKVRDNGDIDADDYAKLEGIGIPREMVAEYVDMVKDRAAAHIEGVVGAFGGEQGFADLRLWAQENLSQEDRDGYDVMLNSPQWKVAVDALRSQQGLPPVAPQGRVVETPNQASPNEASSQGYADQAAMNMAIQDPKYKTDPEFRAEVMRRAAKSSWDNPSRFHNAGL